jgi:hypothetical protein
VDRVRSGNASPAPWNLNSWWREEDSNLRSSQGAADLQSAAINHSAISPMPPRAVKISSFLPHLPLTKLPLKRKRGTSAPVVVPRAQQEKIVGVGIPDGPVDRISQLPFNGKHELLAK